MSLVQQAVTVEELDHVIDQLLVDMPPATTERTTFLREQFDRGLAWVHFAEGCGGLGASPALLHHVMSRLLAAGAPDPRPGNLIGIGMCAPAIETHGTPEQKSRFLRPLFTGEEVWCQMFSEPGAGSDVAGLSMRAERDGDVWRINGQKVWTSLAHLASFGLLLTRTDPGQVKHRGLTAFLLDMHAPGVDVRPLYQMTGEAEFNECFLTDVEIADSMRLGDVGEGWTVALTTLMNERVSIGGQVSPRGSGPIAQAVAAYEEAKSKLGPTLSQVYRDRLMKLWSDIEATRLTNLRAGELRTFGTPGPEGSVAKLAHAELNQKIYEFCVDVSGASGMLYPNSYERVRTDLDRYVWNDPQRSFIRSQANSIEGGTSIIMRNILAERVLGLPGDPRADRDIPWSEVPRN